MRYFILTVVVAIASAAVAGLLFLWLTVKVEHQKKVMQDNHEQIVAFGALGDQLDSVVTAKSQLGERKLEFERLSTIGNSKVDLLAEFSLLIPKSVWLTELSYSEHENVIRLKGRATSAQGIAQFVENLVSSTQFKQVQQRSMVQDMNGNGSFEFALDCLLLGGQ